MTDLVTRDPTTGLRYTPTRWTQTGTTPPPDGCRWCGHEQRGHYQRWKLSAGWHQWTAPTDKQRLARMRARRAQRLAPPPEPTIPLLPDGTPDLTGASIVVDPEPPHRLTVRLIPHRDLAGVDQGPQPHRELQHTEACDALKYGQRCPFDEFEGAGGVDDFPAEPGEYEGWYWAGKSWGDSGWEYDAAIEWRRVEGDAVARETAERTPPGESP